MPKCQKSGRSVNNEFSGFRRPLWTKSGGETVSTRRLNLLSALPTPTFARMPPRPASPLASAKERARRAHAAAVEGDGLAAAIYNRWLATALTSASGMDEDTAAEMFRRLAIALEIMIDMKGWPAGVVRGVTA